MDVKRRAREKNEVDFCKVEEEKKTFSHIVLASFA